MHRPAPRGALAHADGAARPGGALGLNAGFAAVWPQPYEGLSIARRSPDGRLIAAGGVTAHTHDQQFDGRLIVWDSATKRRR
ncbi:hypothetical protein [Deinococcus maricopensis]|uniref:hypothetical protein n=1 Tax=Deinococcus maricopensis TaxID=309887 RepID=UPI0011D216E0|nr:hypothetical protein [Deinococcus maricopensis]